MNFFRKLFTKSPASRLSYEEFWRWFSKNERPFYHSVKAGFDIETNFFDRLSPKLDRVQKDIYYLCGMCDNDTVELILTADGNIKNIVFIEELVNASPPIPGWKFVALKQGNRIEDSRIDMYDFRFDAETLSFYASPSPGYPDEINITVVHSDFTKDHRDEFMNGTSIFLDNFLGETSYLSLVDSLEVTGPSQTAETLIPIEKLKQFLEWRQKEFVEKYEGIRYHTANDNYAMFESKRDGGIFIVATMNTELLSWDAKASHPWMVRITIAYNGQANGLPQGDDYSLMDTMEENIRQHLTDGDGYLSIGRVTGDHQRVVYLACKDFRMPSKVLHNMQAEQSTGLKLDFDIFRDKYWKCLQSFQQANARSSN